jgi:hypothetical protein
MKEINIRPSLFSFSVDLPLPRLDPFNQVLLSELSIRIAEALQAPVSPERFRLRIGDALFSYDLFCSFFGDNVEVKKTAERISLTFKNGRIRREPQSRSAQVLTKMRPLPFDRSRVSM